MKPQNKDVRFTLVMTQRERDSIEAWAARTGFSSISKAVRRAISDAMGKSAPVKQEEGSRNVSFRCHEELCADLRKIAKDIWESTKRRIPDASLEERTTKARRSTVYAAHLYVSRKYSDIECVRIAERMLIMEDLPPDPLFDDVKLYVDPKESADMLCRAFITRELSEIARREGEKKGA